MTGNRKGYTKDQNPNLKTGDIIIEKDPRYFRPTEVDCLLADASKAQKILGWEPKVTFNELVKIMVDADMEMIGLAPPGEGKKIGYQKGIGWTENSQTVLTPFTFTFYR